MTVIFNAKETNGGITISIENHVVHKIKILLCCLSDLSLKKLDLGAMSDGLNIAVL